MRILLTVGLLVLLMLLAGCQNMAPLQAADDSAQYQPPEPSYSLPPTQAGGLFRAGYDTGALVGDRRAVRVGDIVTVVLEESTQSSKSADTSFGKSSSMGIGIPTVFGRQYDRVESSASAERDFDGSASSSSVTPCAAPSR